MLMLQRRDPFREMLSPRATMDRVFQDSFAFPSYRAVSGRLPSFAVDVKETEDGYLVKASLPGIKPEETEVLVKGNTLTIRGHTSSDEETDRNGYLVRERRSGSFQRSMTLPAAVNTEAAEASYEHGVLTVTLPKVDEAKPKQIKVSGPVQAQIEAGEPAAGQPAESVESVESTEAEPAH